MDWIYWAFPLFLLIVGGLVVFVTSLLLWTEWQLRHTGKIIEGEITQTVVKKETIHLGYTYKIDYGNRPVTFKRVTSGSIRDLSWCRLGDKVKIVYLPTRPRSSRLVDNIPSLRRLIWSLTVGIMWLILGVVGLFDPELFANAVAIAN